MKLAWIMRCLCIASIAIFLSIGACILISACSEEIEKIEPINNSITKCDSLIFPNTQKLEIRIDTGEYNFPEFSFNNPSNRSLKIVVSTTEFHFNSQTGNLENLNGIIWEYNCNQQFLTDKVTFNDGNLLDDTYSDLRCKYVNEPNQMYYWAAWQWDSGGNFIGHSTPVNNFKLQNPETGIQFLHYELLYDENSDGLINSGEEISLKLYYKNTSEEPIKDLSLTFNFADHRIPSFPVTMLSRRDVINKDEIETFIIRINIPDHLDFGDTLNLHTSIADRSCYRKEIVTEILITGKNVKIYKILVQKLTENGTIDSIFDSALLLKRKERQFPLTGLYCDSIGYPIIWEPFSPNSL